MSAPDGPPEVTLADVEAVRALYVGALRTARAMYTNEHRVEMLRRKINWEDYIGGLLRDADMRRADYDEVRERFEAQERAKQRVIDETLGKTNIEVARQQVELGARLAEALEEMRRHTERQAVLALRLVRRDTATRREGTKTMPTDKGLQEKQSDRLRVLRAAYELCDGDERAMIPYDALEERSGLNPDRLHATVAWLHSEGLLNRVATGYCAITHAGASEYEQALEDPGERTEHFPSVVINNVINGNVGAFQTGADATASVQQQNNAGSPNELAQLFAALRAEVTQLPEEQQADATEYVDDLEEQKKREKPNQKKLEFAATAIKTLGPTLATIVGQIVATQ